MKRLRHIGLVALILLVCLGVPGLLFADFGQIGSRDGPDAVSSASLALPDQPSGEFVILMNTARHSGSLDQWSDFFLEREVGVIMEDISCLVPASDATGEQLARRYQARLAENQMRLRQENGLLVVSRAENGLFDVIILSREMADAYDYGTVYQRGDVQVITVKGTQP